MVATEDHDFRYIASLRAEWEQDRRTTNTRVWIIGGGHIQGPSLVQRVKNARAGDITGAKNVAVGKEMHSRIKRRNPGRFILRAPARPDMIDFHVLVVDASLAASLQAGAAVAFLDQPGKDHHASLA